METKTIILIILILVTLALLFYKGKKTSASIMDNICLNDCKRQKQMNLLPSDTDCNEHCESFTNN